MRAAAAFIFLCELLFCCRTHLGKKSLDPLTRPTHKKTSTRLLTHNFCFLHKPLGGDRDAISKDPVFIERSTSHRVGYCSKWQGNPVGGLLLPPQPRGGGKRADVRVSFYFAQQDNCETWLAANFAVQSESNSVQGLKKLSELCKIKSSGFKPLKHPVRQTRFKPS